MGAGFEFSSFSLLHPLFSGFSVLPPRSNIMELRSSTAHFASRMLLRDSQPPVFSTPSRSIRMISNTLLDMYYSFMVPFHVIATCPSPSARSAPFLFLPSSLSSLFFSEDCALFSATAVSQPLAYQLLPHSFRRDGGVPPSRCILDLAAHRSPLYSSSFFSHSSALFGTQQEFNSFIFKRFRTLWQKHPGWGGTAAPAVSALREEESSC
jgi:hypothetical protein